VSFSEETAIPVPAKKSEIPFSLQTRRLAIEALSDRIWMLRQKLATDLFGDDEPYFRSWLDTTHYRDSIVDREIEAAEAFANEIKGRAASIRDMEAALKELKEAK
jgi:hypothetical protein